jgi:hypothetical protein
MHITEIGGDSPLLLTVYDELFRPAFTSDELVTSEYLAGMVRKGHCVVASAVDEDNVPQAAAVGEWDPESHVLLLAYMAVRRGRRSGGLGGLLMDQVSGAWQKRYRPALTLAEVEHPLAHATDPERGDPGARLRFYGRHGALALALPYFQPALSPGTHRIHGELLIALPPFPALGPGNVLDPAPVEKFLTGYFLVCEGGIGTDRASDSLWQAVRRPGGIPLLPLDDPAALPVSTPG